MVSTELDLTRGSSDGHEVGPELWRLLKNKDLGWELGLVQVLLQVSMFEKTLLHDIMKAARGAAKSRCAGSNHSQMFCSPLCIAQTPRRARTRLLAGSTAVPAVSLSCSDLLRVLWAAAVRNNGAEMITQTLNLTTNLKKEKKLPLAKAGSLQRLQEAKETPSRHVRVSLALLVQEVD